MKVTAKEIILKNKKKLILRSPESTEAQKLLDHLFITHSESYKNLDRMAQSWKEFPLEKEKEILSSFLVTKNKFLMAAFDNDIIVGGLGLSGDTRPFRAHSATLGMSIQQAFNNQGLGTQMMEYAIETASKANINRIELHVRDYNTYAIQLYENFGFEQVGKLINAAKIDGEFVNEYLYQKIL